MSGTEKQPSTPHAWPLTYKGVPVPYIAAWSQERASDIASGDLVLRTEVLTGQTRLRYRDEQAATATATASSGTGSPGPPATEAPCSPTCTRCASAA
jgi:hypothetical protein